MGLLALPLCEFRKHEIVCPLFHTSVPLSCEQKESELQENGLARRMEGAGFLRLELCLVHACTWTLLHSEAQVCLLSNRWEKRMRTESKDPTEELVTGKPEPRTGVYREDSRSCQEK